VSDELKLYIVSILAISETTDDQGERKRFYTHMPWAVRAADIEAAGDEACNAAGKWFPQTKGYVDCQIDVHPPEVYERLTKSANLEHFGKDLDLKEKPISFRCYTGGEISEGDADVVAAYDRPVS
jgi:hypothetical protein